MTGIDTDMCNIPENIDHNYHIMAYRKDVTGEILSTVPSQPNLLITHKNSMYISGFWGDSSGVLTWRQLNIGDGSDILTTTTSTTTTTTTTPAPLRYVISGTFSINLYYPTMKMVDLMGNEKDITVEFGSPSGSGVNTSYGSYTITTSFNPAGYVLSVSGKDSITVLSQKTWAGVVIVPAISNWTYDASARKYSITCDFTTSILTTTTSTSTTTTTTKATKVYTYQLTLKTGSDELRSCLVTMSHPSVVATVPDVEKIAYNQWAVQFTATSRAISNWTLNVTGTDTSGNTRNATSSVTFTNNVSYLQATVNVSLLVVKPGFDGNITVAPLSLRDSEPEEDTNSLDEAINDYLNE